MRGLLLGLAVSAAAHGALLWAAHRSTQAVAQEAGRVQTLLPVTLLEGAEGGRGAFDSERTGGADGARRAKGEPGESKRPGVSVARTADEGPARHGSEKQAARSEHGSAAEPTNGKETQGPRMELDEAEDARESVLDEIDSARANFGGASAPRNGDARGSGGTEESGGAPANGSPGKGPGDVYGLRGQLTGSGLDGRPSGGHLSGELLAALHGRLQASARRCYPASARRFRLSGEVPLRFCLSGGAVTSLSLEGSTGSEALDRAAKECVLPGAMPLPSIDGCFSVPVQFR